MSLDNLVIMLILLLKIVKKIYSRMSGILKGVNTMRPKCFSKLSEACERIAGLTLLIVLVLLSAAGIVHLLIAIARS